MSHHVTRVPSRGTLAVSLFFRPSLSSHFPELGRVKGSELVGLKYVPMFDYFADREASFVVVEDNYVTNESGTGIVHQVRSKNSDKKTRGKKCFFVRDFYIYTCDRSRGM